MVKSGSSVIMAAAGIACMLFISLPASADVASEGKRGSDIGAECSDTLCFSWSRNVMDGSRTGVECPSADNAAEALGYVKGGKYFAPSGNVYRSRTVRKTAELVMAAQPAMAPVKKVVGYSPRVMKAEYPESDLSNYFIDKLMSATESISGKPVDVGIVNFGGIRVDMPQGDVLVDDIMSMFPFKNHLVYVSLKGSRLREIFSGMAEHGFQVVGGVRLVAKDGQLVSAEIGGEPIDDDRTYGLATISFLLNGGDDLSLSKDALEIIEYPVYIYDAMMDIITRDTAEGKPIEYSRDGRVVILDSGEGE